MTTLKNLLYTRLIQLIVNILVKTNLLVVTGETHLKNARLHNNPLILCGWHGELLFTSFYLHQLGLQPATIISTHKDGEILAGLLKIWKFNPIRGSSSHRSTHVARQLMSLFKKPKALLCLTCDGPRGPRRKAKAGSLKIAQKAGATLIAITGISSRYWTLKSWDKFRIPKPFGKIHIMVSKPFDWPKEILSDQALSKQVSDYITHHQLMCEQSIP